MKRLAFQLGGAQARGQGLAGADRDDGVDDALYLAVQFNRPAPGRCLGAVVVAVEFRQQGAHDGLQFSQRGRAQQILAQLGQQALVHIGAAPGGGVGAGRRALVLVSAAPVSGAVDRDDGAAARVTAQQAAEQSAVGAIARVAMVLAPCGAGLLPQRLFDDAQFGLLAHHPLFPRAGHRQALAGVGVFHPLAPIPHDAADIELIVEQAVAHGGVAHQRAGGPAIAARARHAACVEGVHDAAQRGAGSDLLVNPAHVLRLLFVDLDAAPAVHRHAGVAVGAAAGGHAALELALQAAMRFLAQVVEIELVHQASSDAHHLAPGGLRVVAVGGSDDADAAVLQALDGALLLGQVAGDPVEAFADQHIEAIGQRVGEQRLAALAQRHGRGAADAFVGMNHRDGPAFTRGALAAGAQLVGHAVLRLVVSAVSGV